MSVEVGDTTSTDRMKILERVPDVLRVGGNDSAPTDVPERDRSKFLRERYWIKQWGYERWPSSDFISASAPLELPFAEVGRRPNDPGDAFLRLRLFTSQSTVNVRTWVEVTEVFLPESAEKVDTLNRQYNGLPRKKQIDTHSFLQSLDRGLPNAQSQRDMADRVVSAVMKKAYKGRRGGSYRPLVKDYGRGALIVGLPLWFATFPSKPEDPSMVLTDFCCRLGLGFEAIEHSVLRKNWCPFDSVVVLWNPTLEAIDWGVKTADPSFYSDPANVTWTAPISVFQMYSLLEEINRIGDELAVPLPDFQCHVRWDRYPSVDAMLADQRRRFRLPNTPRPLGPKSCLEVSDSGSKNTLFFDIGVRIFQIWFFVRLHGWRGLRRWIIARFSPGRSYSRWRIRRRARKLYVSEPKTG